LGVGAEGARDNNRRTAVLWVEFLTSGDRLTCFFLE
jgi:hypothetical protein